MSYLRQHKRKGFNGIRSRLFLIVTLLLLLFLLYVGSSFVSSSVHSIVGPIWRVAIDTGGGLSSYLSIAKEKIDLVEENRTLKDELDRNRLISLELDVLEEENDELRAALGMKPREDAKLTRVLARPPRSPYDVLVIDGGRDSGFSVGDRVLFGGSLLLGEIDEVYGSTSRVVLYSSSGMESDVFIDDADGVVTAYGRGGGKFSLELSRDSDVSEGAYLLRVENRIFMLGEIVDVTLPETGAVRIATAKVPVDIFSVRNVFVLSSEGI